MATESSKSLRSHVALVSLKLHSFNDAAARFQPAGDYFGCWKMVLPGGFSLTKANWKNIPLTGIS